MDPIVVRLFASQIQGSASAPGSGSNSAVLSHVRGPNSATPGPNDGFFDRPQDGNIQLNFNGISDAFAANVKKGKRYRMTLEEEPDDAKA